MKKPKTKKQLLRSLRQTWTLRPATKVKESAKVYSRKTKHAGKEVH